MIVKILTFIKHIDFASFFVLEWAYDEHNIYLLI